MICGWWRSLAGVAVTVLLAVAPAGCVTFSSSPHAGNTADPCAAADPAETGPPVRIAIDHDDYRARHIGRTSDGRQFFLTRPFEPGGRQFVALYLFEPDGAFTEARIDAFGSGESAAADRAYGERLAELGAVTYGRISVAPFQVRRFGSTFGLISREPEVEGDSWWVTAEPGDYMAFTAPWDCGLYDT